MKVTRWTLLWLLVVAVMIAIEVLILTGVLSVGNLIGFFYFFVAGLVVIAVLAIVGAVFLGMYVSHRILSAQEFSPFEQEMIRMHQEVRELRSRIEAIAEKLGMPETQRDRSP